MRRRIRRPAVPPGVLSPLLVKNVREVPAYLHGQTRTTLATMGGEIGEVMDQLVQAIRSEQLAITAGPILVYHGVSSDPNKPFDLEIGFPIDPLTETVAGFRIRKLPAFRAATTYYTGSVRGMGQAVGRFYEQIRRAGYIPTEEYRERYLFWEGDDSPNNVVEIQVGIRQQ